MCVGAVVIAVVGDIVAVAVAVLVWRLVGDRVRSFFERRWPTFLLIGVRVRRYFERQAVLFLRH